MNHALVPTVTEDHVVEATVVTWGSVVMVTGSPACGGHKAAPSAVTSALLKLMENILAQATTLSQARSGFASGTATAHRSQRCPAMLGP